MILLPPQLNAANTRGQLMAKAKRKKRAAENAEFLTPTIERGRKGEAERAGIAWRFAAPIRKLFDQDKLTPSQFDALDYYRQQSQQAQDDAGETSPMHPQKAMGGAQGVKGSMIPASLLSTPAQLETARIEADVAKAGSDKLEMLQFVVRDENSLSQWCIHKHGGRERYDGRGRLVAIVPVGERKAMREALASLKEVAKAIVR